MYSEATLAAAKAHLSKDKHLQSLIEKITLEPGRKGKDVYSDLIRSIAGQQLSVKAAATIHGRFLKLFANEYPDPDNLLQLEIEELRAVGFSRQKSTYIQNIARFFVENNLWEKDWSSVSDEAIIDELSAIKGVGRWTVQMILMFSLDRTDVFPVDDLGVVNGMKDLYGIDTENKRQLKKELTAIAEDWRPYRSIACRYIWRYKDAGGI